MIARLPVLPEAAMVELVEAGIPSRVYLRIPVKVKMVASGTTANLTRHKKILQPPKKIYNEKASETLDGIPHLLRLFLKSLQLPLTIPLEPILFDFDMIPYPIFHRHIELCFT